MSDLLKRSLEVLFEGSKQYVKQYTGSYQEIKGDAQQFINGMKDDGAKVREKYAEMKSSSVTKKISEWFYGKESEFDDLI